MNAPWRYVTGRDGVTRIKSTIGIWGDGMSFGYFLNRKEAILATVASMREGEENIKFYKELEVGEESKQICEDIIEYHRNQIKKYREALDYAKRKL